MAHVVLSSESRETEWSPPMKLLTLAATLVALIGLGTVASACDGTKRATTAASQQGDAPVWPNDRQG